jgi:phosphoribosylanthranilate isomerase
MSLKKTVKAGSITHLTDARFFAAYDVDYLGFCFDPQSPQYISPQEALAIKGWITGPKIVAEFANQDIDNVCNIIRFLEPDVAEMSDTYSKEELEKVRDTEVLLGYVTDWEKKNAAPKDVEYVLLRNLPTDIQESIDAPWMIDYASTGILHAEMLQLSGSPEKETGIKTFDDVVDLLDSLQED